MHRKYHKGTYSTSKVVQCVLIGDEGERSYCRQENNKNRKWCCFCKQHGCKAPSDLWLIKNNKALKKQKSEKKNKSKTSDLLWEIYDTEEEYERGYDEE